MKSWGIVRARLLIGIGAVIAGIWLSSSGSLQMYANPPAAADNSPKTNGLSGADLYAIHCNRCHPERYATEFTSAHWKTIMIHMRVRANLPAEQARQILQYLQQDSGQ
jgi:hypothetical protein